VTASWDSSRRVEGVRAPRRLLERRRPGPTPGERIIDVEWDGSVSGQYRAVLEVMAFDRSRLLLDVSKVVAEYHLSIISSSTSTSGSRIVRMVFDVELADPTHLSSLLAALKSVDGVFDAFRQLPGQNKNS